MYCSRQLFAAVSAIASSSLFVTLVCFALAMALLMSQPVSVDAETAKSSEQPPISTDDGTDGPNIHSTDETAVLTPARSPRGLPITRRP
ncbi:MAG: hypothetical protein ISQ07_03795 [Pirellulales bacterium]|nr:hypothetical protein [Pirellulales bacterium]